MVHNIAHKVTETSDIEGTACEAVLLSFRDAMELTDTYFELLDKANKIFKKVNLPVLSARAYGGGSDTAYTIQHGIHTSDSLAVESKNIHSRKEYTLISSLPEAAKRLAAVACCLNNFRHKSL